MAQLRKLTVLERRFFYELVDRYQRPGEKLGELRRRKLSNELKRFGYVATDNGPMMELEQERKFPLTIYYCYLMILARVSNR